MTQIVTLNGRLHDLDYKPSLEHGSKPMRTTPVILNGQMVHGVNINGYDYPPCPSGVVLYLPGLPGYGSTIWDRSNQNNHGTITGATWVRNSKGLWYLDFDGSDDTIEITDASSLGITGAQSVEFWLNLTANTTNETIAQKGNRGEAASGFCLYGGGTANQLWMGASLDGVWTSALVGTITTGTWRHYMAIYTGSAFVLYTNGVAGTPAARSGAVGTNNSSLSIMGLNGFVDGNMSLFRYYNVDASALALPHCQQEQHLFQ